MTARLEGGKTPSTLLTHACWMQCQYSKRRTESSEKQETTSEAGVKKGEHLRYGNGHRSCGRLLDSARAPKVSSRAAKVSKIVIFSTPARLYLYDTLLGWLSHNYHCPYALRWSSRDRRERAGS